MQMMIKRKLNQNYIVSYEWWNKTTKYENLISAVNCYLTPIQAFTLKPSSLFSHFHNLISG